MDVPKGQSPASPTPPAASVTAAQLAQTLGLSRSTVSIVLRGDAERRKISPTTVARVLEAARQYNYVPNFIAQSLRRQRSGIVSVIVSEFALGGCDALMTGLYDGFAHRRSTPFVSCHHHRVDRLEQLLESSARRRDDVVLLQPIAGLEDLYTRHIASGMKLLFIDDYPIGLPNADFVVWDAREATRVAVTHLIERGRNRIAYLGTDDALTMSVATFDVYQQTLTNAGLKPGLVARLPALLPSDEDFERTIDTEIGRLFDANNRLPDALFVASDAIALLALKRLALRHIRVPDQVAVASLGDVWLSDHPGIGLTSVHEPVTELGRQAAAIAIQLIDRKPDMSLMPVQQVLTSATLKPRRTTLG